MPVPQAGSTIRTARGESFVVGQLLGTGGMGTVVEAKHEQSGRRVALKFLHDELLHHPTIPKRFAREVELATSLSTAHVARTFGIETLADGTTFMIIELLAGRDLCTLLRTDKRLPPWRAASIVGQACEALEEAHARGIVHRDVKPENLFICKAQDGSDWVKVLDFGISKIVDERGPAAPPSAPRPKLTRVGTTVGTPEYMAPEQLRGAADLDGSADVYSLGVVLYESLTGERPYVARDYADLVRKICGGEHVPIAKTRTDVPPELIAVIERAMHKDRKARIQTAKALRDALGPWSTSSGGRRAEWTVVMEPEPASLPGTSHPSNPSNPSNPPRPAGVVAAPTSRGAPQPLNAAHPAAVATAHPAQAAIAAGLLAAPSAVRAPTRGETLAEHDQHGGLRGWVVAVVVVVLLLVAAGAVVLFAPQAVGL